MEIRPGRDGCTSSFPGKPFVQIAVLFLSLFSFRAAATTYYVNIQCPTPASPYTNWSTASTDIQSAANLATSGDLVLVTNGVYNNDPGRTYIDPSNQEAEIKARVEIPAGVTVSSVNGPAFTMIPGNPFTCVYVSANATLSGFTLTNGQAMDSGLESVQLGGGAYCQTTNAVISNCLICSNSVASGIGGGVYSGTLNNCILSNNFAEYYGGGSYNSVLNNCTIIGNTVIDYSGSGAFGGVLNDCLLASNTAVEEISEFYGGAAASNVLNNCLIIGNTASFDQPCAAVGSALTNCTIAENPPDPGSDMVPVVSGCVLRNCILYYNSYYGFAGKSYGGSDLENCCAEPDWEFHGGSNNNFTNAPLFINTSNNFQLQPASPCINAGNNTYVTATNDLNGNPRIVGGTVDLGAYEFQTPILYVAVSNTAPVPPFTTWMTAATNIQDALDAASAGDLILVTNGVYATGGRNWYGSGTNRVTLTNSVTLQSVNGPAVTLIVGSRVPPGTFLEDAVRCVGIGDSAVLSGFTLTNGEAGSGNYPAGGGVALVYPLGGGTVTNCVLVDNLATNNAGGGAYRVTLINCQLIGNYAGTGGGACACTLFNCNIAGNMAANGGGVFGGGVYGASVLSNCALVGNSATSGGGAYGGTLNACTISNNTAVNGGGSYGAVLCNSLIVSNSASYGGGINGGVITNCTVVLNTATNGGGGIYGGDSAYGYNSIIYYNNSINGSNSSGAKFKYCDTSPNPFGGGISNAPLFVNLAGGDYHLQSSSPCINSGNNAYVAAPTDLDGNPRITGGTVDIGAYEYQTPASVISYAYLQQYGLPTDGSVDFADLDGTAFNVYQDWIAGLNPTNPASILAMLTPVATNTTTGIKVTWQSVSGITYFLQRSTNLDSQPPFTTIQSNITGQTNTTSYTDTSATGNVPYFYRVGVIAP